MSEKHRSGFSLILFTLVMLAHEAHAASPVPPAIPSAVQIVKQGYGWTFADSEGMTLYIYGTDQKKPNGSLCVAACAELWPPMLAQEGDQAVGQWDFVVRDDGQRQWALQNQPVYRYSADPQPGAWFGDGYDRLWYAAELLIPTPPQISISRTLSGRTLATVDGKTLYNSTGLCEGACLDTWFPLEAPIVAIRPWDDWSVIEQNDGTRQWAYQGKALYTFVGDVNARDVFGNESSSDVWQVVVLEPAPPSPNWVKPIATDAGEMLGHVDGMIIYYHDLKPGRPDCIGYNVACVFPELRPIFAGPEDQPVGYWTILPQADGALQWGYKGHRLYTSTLDKYPGEFRGVVFGGNRNIKVIMTSGNPIQGFR